MKPLVIAMFMFLSSLAVAEGYVPHPEDEIIVKRNGKIIGQMKRSEYKVVKIEDDEQKQEEIKVLIQAKEYKEKHNSVIIHAGVGNDGLDVDSDGNLHEVTEKRKPILGATLCHTKNTFGICATGMSNETYTLGVKKDF
jgi:hypothetical protein